MQFTQTTVFERKRSLIGLLLVLLQFAATYSATCSPVCGSAIRTDPEFSQFTFGPHDDASIGPFQLMVLNFYGATYTDAYLNNNGNLTFGSALTDWTPFPLIASGRPIFAPFFADVDTRGPGSMVVRYGVGAVDGHLAAVVNWYDVGYFQERDDLLNRFQLVVIDRSDVKPGDFDFEFNYEKILWETGAASGGTDGFGGTSARAGWSDGSSHAFELAGSGVNGALLDSNLATGLIHHSHNSDVPGRYRFEVRNGIVVPEPSSFVLALAGATLACWMSSKRIPHHRSRRGLGSVQRTCKILAMMISLVLLFCQTPARAAITYEVTFDDPGGAHSIYYPALTSHVIAGGVEWGRRLQSADEVSLEIEIAFADIPTATGSSIVSNFVRFNGTYNVFEQGAAAEVRSGIDPNGTDPDIRFTFGTDYLANELYFSPDPFDASLPVPADRTDAVSVMMHEFGHAYGFNGWRDHFDHSLPADFESTYDELQIFDGIYAYFTGATAMALYGGPVPLTFGNTAHLGNSPPGPGTELRSDLMGGVYFFRGQRYDISELDWAILYDVGLPVLLVPEPSTLSLAGVALASLAFARRWCRRTSLFSPRERPVPGGAVLSIRCTRGTAARVTDNVSPLAWYCAWCFGAQRSTAAPSEPNTSRPAIPK